MPRIFIILFLIFLIPACSGDDIAKNTAPAAPVRVEKVSEGDISRTLQAIGNVKPSASVGLVPRVAGEILAVNFIEGQDVKEGQKLIQIDPRPYEATLQEKRGILAKSQAQLAKAREDRKRFGKLVGEGYVSREAFEQTATDAAALAATTQADRAAVESAALDLAYCNVTAPINGRISALNVDKGNMVKSNDSTPIATIDTISPCYVVFSVPEIHLPAILDHMNSGVVSIIATPAGGKPENGLLTLIDNKVDEKTGAIRLRGTFKNTGRHLWPGQFAEVKVPLGTVENALLVPTRAVQRGRDESFVYVIDENKRANYRKIEILFEENGQSAVKADLKSGDLVVVEGQVRLTPGSQVNIIN